MSFGLLNRSTKHWPNWLLGLSLVIVTIAVYQPAWHAGFIWDDDVYIINNELLSAPDGLWRIWFTLDSPSQYFPLVYTTFRIEHGIWGLNPAGYHWVNIVLHAVNALLVWRVLWRLRVPGPWIAAAIWALHPVQVESVAWITERKNVLMGLFFLLSLLRWIAFCETAAPVRWWHYTLALLFYLLALSSKTTACTLPAALLLVLWLNKEPITCTRLLEIVPFVLLGVGMGLVTVWWERFHQGTIGKMFVLGPIERLLVASRAVWFYLGKLIWPEKLTFSYPRWKIDPSNLSSYAWLAAAIGIGFAIWRTRRRFGRGVEVAALFFVATLGPMLGFVMLYTFRYTFVADHYQYLAALGPIALFAALVGRIPKPVAQTLSVLVLIMLGALTWSQCAMYHDAETLWRTTISLNPSSSMAYNNLSFIHQENGDWDTARSYAREALALDPESPEALDNVGTVLEHDGRLEEALPYFWKEVQTEPQYVPARLKLANILRSKGQFDEAVAQLGEAIEIKPDYTDAHNNLGLTLQLKGQIDEAMTQYRIALDSNPSHAEANNNLGLNLLQQGRVDEAVMHLQNAVKSKPDYVEAHNNLGNALCQKGDPGNAIAHYRRAVELDPDSADAYNNLAHVLATARDARLRNGAEAQELALHANQLSDGRNPVYLANLAAAYAEQHYFDKAVEAVTQALQIAQAQGNAPLINLLQNHRHLYESEQPLRD